MISFVIKASDIARCPDHNMSVEHWRPDGTCQHEPVPLKHDNLDTERHDTDEKFRDLYGGIV